MKAQPNYAFSPSLLDAYQRMVSTKPEEFFYQDEAGAWHLNWNETEEMLHYSEEEVDALLRQEFIDYVNRVPSEPSEAASRGTAFNDIIDCLVLKRKPSGRTVIKTIRSGEDLYEAKTEKARMEENSFSISPHDCDAIYAKVGTPFIYSALDGFEFFFDKDFCREAGEYFGGSICQYYTKANLETTKGIVELHGYIDYLRMMHVYDAKTTKRYSFGDYQTRWQRYAYPFTLIESGMMNEIQSFEFTVYVLKGGSGRTPLISGTQFREVYTYDHEQARTMLTQQCERLIEFLEANRHLITNEKIFGNGTTDNR